nr:RNA-dependent RNA polymerase [Metarhizium anisopliae polymycovirus 1]
MSLDSAFSELPHVRVLCQTPAQAGESAQGANREPISDVLGWVAQRYARGGVRRKDLNFRLRGVAGRKSEDVTLRSVIEPNSVLPEVPTTRPPYRDVGGDTAEERMAGLAEMETSTRKKSKAFNSFDRKAARLADAVAKRARYRNPSFQICRLQLPFTYGFRSKAVSQERGLLAPTLEAVRRVKKRPGYPKEASDALDEAIDLGDYTVHDPETLPKRFLEYVHERIDGVCKDTQADFIRAVEIMYAVWRSAGVEAKARPFSEATPEGLDELFTSGNAGEYRKNGVESRRDPRALRMLSEHVQGFSAAGRNLLVGLPPPPFVDRLDHVTTSFGKREPKRAKMVGGTRVPPVPRFIFNPSPCSYAMGAFLHHDISHSLQSRDPLHGPGFGPGRGRAIKLTRVVARACPEGTILRDGAQAVMSDIEKWDANMSEFLIRLSFDALEAYVDKSDLSDLDRASREAACRYMRRTLMEKLVEHPSGYLVHLYGCMPSGSFYTSLLNTVGNTLLALALVARRCRLAGVELDVAKAALAADGALLSYGDNQLIITTVFKELGVDYDIDDHAALLREVGMRLKKDETEVSNRLDRIRFCSRAVVRTPDGFAITRTHADVVAKLVARPTDNNVDDKLYVRAMMADYLGVDPIVHRMLCDVDATIRVNVDAVRSCERHRDTLRSAAATVYGRKDDDAIVAVAQLMAQSTVDRRVLLELTQPRSVNSVESVMERTGAPTTARYRTRFAASLGIQDKDPHLEGPARWLANQDEVGWLDYLSRTNQLGVLY